MIKFFFIGLHVNLFQFIGLTLLVLNDEISLIHGATSLLTEWRIDNNTFPCLLMNNRNYAVYDESRDSIFGIAGLTNSVCAYKYNLTANEISSISVTVESSSTSFVADMSNPDSCTAALIDQDTMVFLDRNGNIWQYDINTSYLFVKLVFVARIHNNKK